MNGLQSSFFASLIFATINGLKDTGVVRQCNILVSAANPDEALAKAQAAGVARLSEMERFLGVEELLIIQDEVQDGVELAWEERLWTENDLKKFLEENVNAALLGDNNLSPVGWYVGEITLQEVVDESAGYQEVLIWKNTYLLKEPNGQCALQRLETMGQLEQEVGAHTSDGYNATWKFLGVSMLRPVEELPADGSLLWCERLNLSPAQIQMPSRDELGVFKWLNRKR